MKCHLCNQELMASNYANWEVGGRKEITYICANKKCQPQQVSHRTLIDLILPDNEISAYVLLFKIKSDWYRIYSKGNYTALYKKTLEDKTGRFDEIQIISVDKSYPIHITENLAEATQRVYDRLKTLVIFS